MTHYTPDSSFKWTPDRTTAAQGLATGRTQQQVAEEVGVDRRTIRRWLGDSVFAAEVDRLTLALSADRVRAMKRQVEPLSLQTVILEYNLLLATYREMAERLNEAPGDFTITQLIDNARRIAGRLERRLSEKSSGEGRSLRLRYEVLARDGFTCRYCGRSPLHHKDVELQVDHIFPESKGGEYVLDNLVTSCRECNNGKRDVILDARAREGIEARDLFDDA